MKTRRLTSLCIGFVLVLSLGRSEDIAEPPQNLAADYRLFKTQNFYTLLRLDTRSGQVWQIHWATEEQRPVAVVLNAAPLASNGKPGRFTLYPTMNMYNFILLDQENGTVWQIQWSFTPEKRLIIRIG